MLVGWRQEQQHRVVNVSSSSTRWSWRLCRTQPWRPIRQKVHDWIKLIRVCHYSLVRLHTVFQKEYSLIKRQLWLRIPMKPRFLQVIDELNCNSTDDAEMLKFLGNLWALKPLFYVRANLADHMTVTAPVMQHALQFFNWRKNIQLKPAWYHATALF